MNEKTDTTTTKTPEPKKKSKLPIILALTGILVVGAIIGIYLIVQSASYITTDNARVTTTQFRISSNTPGVLERFTISAGQYVEENEVLGWVENGEAMRSPVDGFVLHSDAVQGQSVAPMETLAVIADINRIHIAAYIEETYIARLQLGQRAIVTIDGLGNRQFYGYVADIGRITQAELTGQALFFNTGGVFTRVTHLLPVEINIQDDINLHSLIGVNARVRIPADSAPVQAEEVSREITVTGAVESGTSRNIYSTLGFMIDRVFVSAGDRVEEGQILAMLDTADLELTIAQQQAALELARQNSQNAVSDAQRMLNEAQANLTNNTNLHIVSAGAALDAAQSGLEAAQRSYDNARADYTQSTNPQVLGAESFLRTATLELERAQLNHTNLSGLYAGGIISSDEMRQSENALTLARNQYNDARTGYENARDFERRTLEQLRIALDSAMTARNSAEGMLSASRIAASQEIEMLRSHVASAQVSANLEHMEAALEQLERHLSDAAITAPIAGTVTSVIAREGAVGMGLLFTVEDTGNLKIMTSFREYDLAGLAAGMEVRITSDGTGGSEYTGTIRRINPAALPSSPIAEFEAEIAVPADTSLRIGMNTRVTVALE